MKPIKFTDVDLDFSNEVELYGYPDHLFIASRTQKLSIKPESRLEAVKLRNYYDEIIDNWVEDWIDEY